MVFMITTSNSLLGWLLISTSFSSSLGFLSVLSFGIYSSVTSFCLNCCFCVYVFVGLHFPILEKWSYVRSILWSPAEHSLLDTKAICSRGALCVDCLVPSVGSLVGIACPQPGCLWSRTLWVATLCWRGVGVGGLGPGMAGCMVRVILVLVPACCWVRQDQEGAGYGALGGVGGGCGASIGLLVGRTSSWHSWLKSPRYSEVGVCSLVSRAGPSGSWTGTCPLVGGAEFWVLWLWGLRALELVLALWWAGQGPWAPGASATSWWVGPGLGPFGGWGRIRAQRSYWQLSCWWMGLCSHSATCQDWFLLAGG